MLIDSSQRQLYARHLLLPEIGESGQARLCAAGYGVGPEASKAAAATAVDYLVRAGMTMLASEDAARDDAPLLLLPDDAGVSRLAGQPLLQEAAAALAGAFAAVEAIKAVTGAGEAARFPRDLCLGAGPK